VELIIIFCNMHLRSKAKSILFGRVPLLRGRFKYFGHSVSFPIGSQLFERTCRERIFEQDVVRILVSLAEPGTTFIDVGSNIGLLAIPVLASCPGTKIISIEASPETLSYLRRTQSRARRQCDWEILGAAVGAHEGEAKFWTGDCRNGEF